MVTIIGLEGMINEILIPIYHALFALTCLIVLYFSLWFIILYGRGEENFMTLSEDLDALKGEVTELKKDTGRIIAILKSNATDAQKVAEIRGIVKATDDEVEEVAPEPIVPVS